MKPIAPTDLPALTFTPTVGGQKYNAQAAKIGWVRALAPKAGAISFDLTIKDALGRVRLEKPNCKTSTTEYGELINFPTNLGEELQVEVSNLKGTDKLTVFLN